MESEKYSEIERKPETEGKCIIASGDGRPYLCHWFDYII